MNTQNNKIKKLKVLATLLVSALVVLGNFQQVLAATEVGSFTEATEPTPVTSFVQTDGDGFKPIPTSDRVYSVFHHSAWSGTDPTTFYDNPDVFCLDKKLNQQCFTPKPLTVNGNNVATELDSPTVFDSSKMRLYFSVSVENINQSGVLCYDLNTDQNCSSGTNGFFSVTNSGLMDNGFGREDPPLITFETPSENFQGKVYTYDRLNKKIRCNVVDSSYGSSCAADLDLSAYDFRPNSVSANPYFFGGNYYLKTYEDTPSPHVSSFCYNPNTGNFCNGSSPQTFPLVQYPTSGSFGVPTTNRVCSISNEDGAPLVAGSMNCIDSNGVVYSSTGVASLDNMLSQSLLFIKNATTYQNRIYIPARTDPGVIYCYDFNTNAPCANYLYNGVAGAQRITTDASKDYSYTIDAYAQGRCAWGLGDAGLMFSFNLQNPTENGSCGDSLITGTVSLPCETSGSSWGDFSIVNVDVSDPTIDSASASFYTDSSKQTPLIVNGNSNTVDMKANGGTWDMSQTLGPNILSYYVEVIMLTNGVNDWGDPKPTAQQLYNFGGDQNCDPAVTPPTPEVAGSPNTGLSSMTSTQIVAGLFIVALSAYYIVVRLRKKSA